MQEVAGIQTNKTLLSRFVFAFVLSVSVFAASGTLVHAAVSSTTNCAAVSCQSDSSISGSDVFAAGTEVCDNAGMDYAPACNSAKCVDSSGQGSYACVARVAVAKATAATGASTTGSSDGIPNPACTTGGFRCINPSLSCASTGDSNLVEDSSCNSVCGGGFKICRSKSASTSTSSGTSTTSTSESKSGDGCEVGFEKISGVCFPTDTQLPDPKGGFLQIIDNLLRWLLAIFAILAIAAFVISGIQYLVSAGDDDMIETAKRNMKWSAVGVMVGLSGWLILQAISSALSGTPGF